MANQFDTAFRKPFTASQDATKSLNDLQALTQSGSFNSGKLAQMKASLGNWAVSMGANPDDPALKNAKTLPEFQSAAGQLVVSMLSTLHLGRVTNYEIQMLRGMKPDVANTPQANQLLIDTMRKSISGVQQNYNVGRQFIQANGGRPIAPDGTDVFQAIDKANAASQGGDPASGGAGGGWSAQRVQ